MFAIDIASLEPGLHTFEYEPEAAELDLDPKKFKDIRVQARLDVEERRILVVLDVRAVAELECDRTLRLFDQEIGDTYHVLFAPPEFMEKEDDGFNEIRVFDPADQEIELTDVVRDTVLLSVPQRCVAPGAEEEEIPTRFGAPEDDVDPRWEALRELKSGSKR